MKAIDRPSAELTNVRVIGVLGMGVFSCAALMSWRAGEGTVALLFLVFVALGLYLFLGAGQISADSNGVMVSSVLGRHRLAWQQVRRVESSAYGTLVLHADDARLVLPAPLLWSGPRKQALTALILEQLRGRSLVIQRSWSADYRINKNVRIRRARSG